MFCPVITDNPSGIKAIQVGVFLSERYQAIGGQQHRAVERIEFAVLMPPRTAVVADKVRIFFESRIIIGRQHFAVGIDIDARTLRLLEQVFHIFQIMAADKYARVLAHADIDLGDFRMAIGGGIGFVEQGHSSHRYAAGLHDQSDHLLGRQLLGDRS
ncbi:MAG: hypothetical protein ACD_75C00940G0002 [uncultured bacterium]|nr:MAG: hypothetical protein ACD_75C00940G0002 [uncultured bacterium]